VACPRLYPLYPRLILAVTRIRRFFYFFPMLLLCNKTNSFTEIYFPQGGIATAVCPYPVKTLFSETKTGSSIPVNFGTEYLTFLASVLSGGKAAARELFLFGCATPHPPLWRLRRVSVFLAPRPGMVARWRY